MTSDIYKLLNGRVRIVGDSLMGLKEAQRFSCHVKHSIDRAFQHCKDKPDWSSYGGSTVWTMINDTDDSMFKRVALHVFGTNFPDAIDKLKTLQIYVEGRCPDCGEPTREAYQELREATNDIPGEGIEFDECTLCGCVDL